MTRKELKIARIGNSRGVRIPAATLDRYAITESVIMEETTDGILLRPVGPVTPRISWEDTARAMAKAAEDWSEWEATNADGLDSIPWHDVESQRVAEPTSTYSPKRNRRKK